MDVLITRKTALLVLLVSIGFNSTGQVLFKASRIAYPDASIIELFSNIQIWIGLVLFGLSSIIWLWVLSKAPLSFAYPLLALSFPIVVTVSAIAFSETVSLVQVAGIGLIILGVSLLART